MPICLKYLDYFRWFYSHDTVYIICVAYVVLNYAFIDSRLIEFFRKIPSRKGGENIFTKQEILKFRDDIFIKEQFRPKRGQAGQVRLFLEKKSNLAISILENSVLGSMGIIKSSEIIDSLKGGDTKKYFEGDTMSFLLALLRLELYLQNGQLQRHRPANTVIAVTTHS